MKDLVGGGIDGGCLLRNQQLRFSSDRSVNSSNCVWRHIKSRNVRHKDPFPAMSRAKLEQFLLNTGPPPLDVPRNVADICLVISFSYYRASGNILKIRIIATWTRFLDSIL